MESKSIILRYILVLSINIPVNTIVYLYLNLVQVHRSKSSVGKGRGGSRPKCLIAASTPRMYIGSSANRGNGQSDSAGVTSFFAALFWGETERFW